MLEFEKIEIVKDEDISKDGVEFYSIYFKYVFNGEEDETVLECVNGRDVYLAVQAIMKDPVNFREMYP